MQYHHDNETMPVKCLQSTSTDFQLTKTTANVLLTRLISLTVINYIISSINSVTSNVWRLYCMHF